MKSLIILLLFAGCGKDFLEPPILEPQTTQINSTVSPSSTLRIEAESYSNHAGTLVTDVCSEGGYNVGGIQAGEWMDYDVTVPATGTYQASFRVAGPGGTFQFKLGSTVLCTITVPNTGGYQKWTTVSASISLTSGVQTLRIYPVTGGYNINWFELLATSVSSPDYFQIEAENYTAMSGLVLDNCSEGGKNIGGIQTGDWADYSVNIQTAGTYTVKFRVAGPGGTFQLKNSGGTVLASLTVTNTGSYQTWATISSTATFPSGVQTLRIYATSGGYNINYFQIYTVEGTTISGGGPVSPNLLYRETFEGATIWQGGVGRECVTSYGQTVITSPAPPEGVKAFRFELRDGDANSYPRSEINWPASYASYNDRWFSFWVYWPSATEGSDSKPEICHQVHQTAATSPPLSLHIQNGHLQAEINGQIFTGQLGNGSGTINTDLGAVPTDTWVHFVCHYKFSVNTDGRWQIFKDGVSIYNYTGKTLYPASISTALPSFKIGIYKWPWTGTGTSDVTTRVMLVDDVRIGNEACTLSDM